MKEQTRADFFPIPLMDSDAREVMPFRATPDGYLYGRAIVTGIGVFPYYNEDGEIYYELRAPEEVFSTASIETLRMIPVTNDHPSEMVTMENIKSFQVGYGGDGVSKDEYYLYSPMVINDAQAIEDVKGGKRALSCGYKLDIIEESGVWLGSRYDAKQVNIRYNHIAIVPEGRAGDEARIRMDSKEKIPLSPKYQIYTGVGLTYDRKNKKIKAEDRKMSELKKVKIEGVEYDAEAKVIENLDKAEKELAKLKEDMSKGQAAHDTLKEKYDAALAEVKKAKDVDIEAMIQDRLDESLEILSNAKTFGVEHRDMDGKRLSLNEIKKGIILKTFPNAKNKLEERKDDQTYLDSRYDAAIENLTDIEKANHDNKITLADSREDDRDNPDIARDKMIADMENRYISQAK